MKIRHEEAEVFFFMRMEAQADRQTGRRTGMTKPIVAFRNFANAPETFYNCRLVFLRVCPHPVS